MTSDELGVAEPHLAAPREAPETMWWLPVEVVLLDAHLAELDDSRPGGRLRRVPGSIVEAQVATAAEFLPQAHNSALACARWRKPFGSRGKRVTTTRVRPVSTSHAMMLGMKVLALAPASPTSFC